MDRFLDQPGQRYHRYRAVYLQGFGEYRIGGMIAAKYVGGISHPRDRVGDPDGRPPFTPVPAGRQREALDLLADRLWSKDSFLIPAAGRGFSRLTDMHGPRLAAAAIPGLAADLDKPPRG